MSDHGAGVAAAAGENDKFLQHLLLLHIYVGV